MMRELRFACKALLGTLSCGLSGIRLPLFLCVLALAAGQAVQGGEPAALVKDINPNAGASSTPQGLVNVGGTVFFSTDIYDFATDTEFQDLWKSDGTSAGTTMVKADIGYMGQAVNVNGTLFFGSNQLWKSDGTDAGTVLLSSNSPSFLANVNGTLFFQANDGTHGAELWRSDGTAAGTVMVKDIWPGGLGSDSCRLTNVNGTSFFEADDGTNGYELWKSDGTAAGTVMVKDIYPGGNSSYPENFTNLNGTLFFKANDGTNGYRLWTSDGTSGGTVMVGGSPPNPSYLMPAGGTLFFTTGDGNSGMNLWAGDGTSFTMLQDIYNGANPDWGTDVSAWSSIGSRLFVTFTDGESSQLWVSDGTVGGTVLLLTYSGANWDSGTMADVNGTLFFAGKDQTHGMELWKSDGTVGGTVMVQDIQAEGSSRPNQLTVCVSTLLFQASEGLTGTELWGMPFSNATLPCITSAPTATGTVGSAFSFKITASDSPTSYSISVLPAGLNLDPNGGAISGTPTKAGVTAGTVSATNATGTRSTALTIVIDPASFHNVPVINTIAGTGHGSPFSDGDAALDTALKAPTGLASDAAGNIYFSDTWNNVVRKLGVNGIVTTVAGDGTNDAYDYNLDRMIKLPLGMYGGDGDDATLAQLNLPTGLAVDSTGNLYIADTGNQRIRKVDTKGIITTVAGDNTTNSGPHGIPVGDFGGDGGDATLAQLNGPMGVAVDQAGNLFIADTGNHRIREVDTDGIITTVAGDGATNAGLDDFQFGDFNGDGQAATSASLNGPTSVAVDGTGKLFIADTINQRIRKVDTNGIITTVAGTGNNTAGLLGLPFGTYDGDSGSATAVSLNLPSGLALDSSGLLYIADCANHRIRRVNLGTGMLDTLAGGPVPGFAGDGEPASVSLLRFPASLSLANGSLLVTDVKNKRIRQITLAAVPTSPPINNATPAAPVITSATTVTGTLGTAFSYKITASNSPTSYNATGLPSWASIDTNTGAITGISDAIGSTSVTISASNGSGTGSATLTITIGTPPSITSIANSEGGSVLQGDPITFTAQVNNPNGSTLTYTWDFGDGTPLGTSTTNSASHAFATGGQYTVTLTVSDGIYTSQPQQIPITVYAPNSGGENVQNLADGRPPVANPLNGLSIGVEHSDGGVVELTINVDALNKAAFNVSTSFNGTTSLLSQVAGIHPYQKFTDPSVYVATSTASDAATNTPQGKARLTLAVSNREVGMPASFTQVPKSQGITFKGLKGKFRFGAASKAVGGADMVTASMMVELPVGLNVAAEQDLTVGVGNIIDHVKVDNKGRGKGASDNGSLKKASIKYPKVDKTTNLTAGTSDKRIARIDLTLSASSLVSKGFDTEGVDPSGNGKQLHIQSAVVLGGVAYQGMVQVGLTVPAKKDAATITQSRK